MASLSRRALFALPLVLPVAAATAAAKPALVRGSWAEGVGARLVDVAPSDFAGGYLVPEEFRDKIIEALSKPILITADDCDLREGLDAARRSFEQVRVAVERAPSETDPPADLADDRAMAWEG